MKKVLYYIFENWALPLTMEISTNSSSNSKIRGSFGICSLWRFWNCHWYLWLMKNWQIYSRLKARLNFRKYNELFSAIERAPAPPSPPSFNVFHLWQRMNIHNFYSLVCKNTNKWGLTSIQWTYTWSSRTRGWCEGTTAARGPLHARRSCILYRNVLLSSMAQRTVAYSW